MNRALKVLLSGGRRKFFWAVTLVSSLIGTTLFIVTRNPLYIWYLLCFVPLLFILLEKLQSSENQTKKMVSAVDKRVDKAKAQITKMQREQSQQFASIQDLLQDLGADNWSDTAVEKAGLRNEVVSTLEQFVSEIDRVSTSEGELIGYVRKYSLLKAVERVNPATVYIPENFSISELEAREKSYSNAKELETILELDSNSSLVIVDSIAADSFRTAVFDAMRFPATCFVLLSDNPNEELFGLVGFRDVVLDDIQYGLKVYYPSSRIQNQPDTI